MFGYANGTVASQHYVCLHPADVLHKCANSFWTELPVATQVQLLWFVNNNFTRIYMAHIWNYLSPALYAYLHKYDALLKSEDYAYAHILMDRM